jgi:hypothetical protein
MKARTSYVYMVGPGASVSYVHRTALFLKDIFTCIGLPFFQDIFNIRLKVIEPFPGSYARSYMHRAAL